MRKLNRLHTFALSVAMTGLSMMPVWAFSGQIDSGSLETVTCINYDTGQAVSGTAGVGGFDCSALSRGLEDRIGVVLVGTSEEQPPPCGTVQEVESNDDIDQAQDLGDLGDCGSITVVGRTTSGFVDPDKRDPNADADWYVINIAGAAQPQIEFLDFIGMLSFRLVDFFTENMVDVECDRATCAILGQHDTVALRVTTQEPSPYTLKFSDRVASQGLSSSSSATPKGQILYESQ